ncbi:hypothetical protein V865_001755 [Kwoniella europaea PYCC6329]|uniref:Uncharacterized protein n=1 Tax=Kwoniella europaea PYCC6329 TaxID=1423913 RepID=A0AAX4KBZ8_9TREE
MPLTLLHLSDEIIRNIAYYVHLDNAIPIPSFNPHWANFKDEIDPANQKDYIAFRSSCKRIRELCPGCERSNQKDGYRYRSTRSTERQRTG